MAISTFIMVVAGKRASSLFFPAVASSPSVRRNIANLLLGRKDVMTADSVGHVTAHSTEHFYFLWVFCFALRLFMLQTNSRQFFRQRSVSSPPFACQPAGERGSARAYPRMLRHAFARSGLGSALSFSSADLHAHRESEPGIFAEVSPLIRLEFQVIA